MIWPCDRVAAGFVMKRGIRMPVFEQTLLSWKPSGFSVDAW